MASFQTNRQAEVEAAVKDLDFAKNTYQVEFQTTMGKIRLDVYPDVAPGHSKNLIGLTKIGFYDGLTFHRVIHGFVIQTGCPQGDGTGYPGYTISPEFNDELHEAGILSMARTDDPNTAGSQFFICLGRLPTLDRQYTVVGKTADQSSLDVVLNIGRSPTGSGDRPKQNIRIISSRVIVTLRANATVVSRATRRSSVTEESRSSGSFMDGITGGQIAVALFGLLFLFFWFSPKDPKTEYKELIELRTKRLDREAEDGRIRSATERVDRAATIEAIIRDRERHPERYNK